MILAADWSIAVGYWIVFHCLSINGNVRIRIHVSYPHSQIEAPSLNVISHSQIFFQKKNFKIFSKKKNFNIFSKKTKFEVFQKKKSKFYQKFKNFKKFQKKKKFKNFSNFF